MLNEADSYQGGGSAGAEASDPVEDAEALFRKLKRFVKTDYNSKGQVNWRRETREDFDFESRRTAQRGRQGDFVGRKAPYRHFQPRRNNGRLRRRSGSRQPTTWSAATHANSLFETP